MTAKLVVCSIENVLSGESAQKTQVEGRRRESRTQCICTMG